MRDFITSFTRKESPFVDSLYTDTMVHVATVRSPSHKGKILSIDFPVFPRDYFVLTAADIKGKNSLVVYGVSVPILAEENVLYKGEPIALIAGPDLRIVLDLVEKTKVHIEELDPILECENFASCEDDSIVIRREADIGESDLAFSLAYKIVEGEYSTGSQEHWYSEPQGAFAAFEYDKLVVYSSTQWPFHVRESVSEVLDIDNNDVIVRPTAVGVHLDGKLWYPSLIAVHAALCAVSARKNARLILERKEDFLYSIKRARSKIHHKTALSEDGTILAMDISILCDTGAYGPMADEMLDRMCIGSIGIYNCKNIRIRGKAVRTNTPPLGAFSGFGLSQAFFALETHVNKLSRSLGVDPLSFRINNMTKKGDVLLNGEVVKETAPIIELGNFVIQKSDFLRKYASYELLKLRRTGVSGDFLRGSGFTTVYQGSGFLGKGEEKEVYSAEAVFEKDLKLRICSSAVASNSESLSLWQTLAAGILDIPVESVIIEENTSDRVPDSGPSTLSRNMTIIPKLIEKCCEGIQKKRFRDALPIQIKRSFRLPSNIKWTNRVFEGAAFCQQSWAACVVEIEVDPELFFIRVRKVFLCIDAGKIISETRARSNLEAGILGALSFCSREFIVPGRTSENAFYQYRPLGIGDAPEMHIQFINNTDKAPVKGLGDLPYHAIPSAYVQAVNQALDTDFTFIPVRESMLHEEVSL